MHIPYKDRVVLSDNLFIEMDIKKMGDEYKFSVVLIKDNKRVFGFDNHESKLPHKHIGSKVYDYDFKGIDKLIQDFYEELGDYI
jgi:hypothetical protein